MKLSNKTKKIIIISSVLAGSAALLTGVAVGGYYSSVNANPYKEFYRTPASDTDTAFLSSYYSAQIYGAELLLLPGFSLNPSMSLALKNAKFNNMGFLLIDDAYSGESTSQVATVRYRVDEGSFVTGVAIGQYLNQYKDYFDVNGDGLTWGTYGGMNFPSVTSFMAGFQSGIDWFNKNIVPKKPGFQEIRQVVLGPTYNDNYANGFGPSDGNPIIDKFLVRGGQDSIDCLIPVAGPQTVSAVSKISVKKGKRTIVVGVDSAIEDDKSVKGYTLPQVSGINCPKQILPFSSLKKIDTTVPQIINKINEGATTQANNIGGFGFDSLGDINNNGVGVSKAGEQYVVDALKILDPSVSDYNAAINKLKTESQFNQYFTSNNGSGDFAGVFKAGSGTFEYALPTAATQYAPVPKTKPADIPDAQMTQKQWESKLTFNLKGFIKDGVQSDEDKIKIVLSTSSSVLMDASFSQAAYLGLYYFYKEHNINIPPVKG